MTTLADLKAGHPEWCWVCGWEMDQSTHETLISHTGGIQSPVIAALIAKALEDQARIEEQNTAAKERARQINQLKDKLRNPEKRFADLQAQLTAEREAHAVTRKALEEADGALFKASDWPDAHSYGYLPEFEAALAREEARKKEVKG